MQVYNLLRKGTMSKVVTIGTCGENASIDDTSSRPVSERQMVRHQSPAMPWGRSVGQCLFNLWTMVGLVVNAVMKAL